MSQQSRLTEGQYDPLYPVVVYKHMGMTVWWSCAGDRVNLGASRVKFVISVGASVRTCALSGISQDDLVAATFNTTSDHGILLIQ
jgi:hypothetical protein